MSEDRGIAPSAAALAFILGGALGASLALLFAPVEGSQARQRLRRFAHDLSEKTADLTEDMRDRMEEAMEQGRDMYEEKKSLLSAAVKAGKNAMNKEREKLREL